MNNLKKTLFITTLMLVIVAPYTGCQKALSNKGTRQALTNAGDRVRPVLAEVLESGVAKQLAAETIETGPSGRRIASSGVFQSVRSGSAGRSGVNFVPDKHVDRYIAVPEGTTSYRYGGILKGHQPHNLNTVINTIASAKGEPNEATGVKEFLSYLDESASEYIIIIVHNKQGVVSFPNGDKMSLEEMARLINERNKEGIFLSCEAKNYLPDHPASTVYTTLNEALSLSEELAEKLRGDSGQADRIWESPAFTTRGLQLGVGNQLALKSYNMDKVRVRKQIQEIINAGERKAEVEHKVFLIKKGGPIVVAGAGVKTYGVYYYISLKNSGKTPKVSPPKTLLTPSNSVVGRVPPTQWSNPIGLSR